MADEESAAGPGMSGSFSGTAKRGRFGRSMQVDADFSLNIPGLDTAAAGLGQVNTALQALQDSLKSLSSNKYQLQSGINSLLTGIEAQAKSTAGALSGVTSAIGGMGSGGGGGGGGGGGRFASAVFGAYSTPQGSGYTAGDAQAAASGTTGNGLAAPIIGGGGLLGMMGDVAMMPMRFMRDRIQNNRQSALYMQQSMSQQAFASNRSNAEGMMGMMGSLANMPNGIMGTPADVMSIMGIGRQIGAQFGYGNGINGGRAGGFFTGISQLQRMSPGTPSSKLAEQLGGQIGNVAAERESAFLTGGVFGLTARGGKMKSVQEWAEGILRWLENQRPGRDRGKAFNYGEMLAQHFPGSNIDAWLSANGVSADMKEYFWTYAEGKAKSGGSTQGGPFDIAPPRGNLAFERVRSQQEFTKSEFGLASKMSGQYANREQSNQWFNALMGQIVNKVIPGATGKGGPLNVIQNLPDFIEDLLFGLLEGAGPIGQMAGSGMVMGNVGAYAPGDVGDVGGYGTMGGTSTAGLHPDMRSKVNRMMKANPNIKVTSGLRDRSTQQRLKRRGFSNVSGGPSAHTRGMAADLGPSSQYGWIAANAKRFGLSSGQGQGEPWHVGMGDIGDGVLDSLIGIGKDAASVAMGPAGMVGGWVSDKIGSGVEAAGGISDVFNMLKKLFSGFLDSVDSVANIVGKGAGSIFNLTNILGGKSDVTSVLQESIPGLMSSLMGNFLTYGAKDSPAEGFNKNMGLPTAFTFGAVRGAKPQGSNTWGSPGAMNIMEGGGGGVIAAAQAAASVGFRGEALQRAIAIAQAESGLNPTAHNGKPPDNSYGLWQINMLGNLGTDRRRKYGLSSNEELFDPMVNARAAWDISGGGTNFAPWSTYKNGAYAQYMDEARSGMAAAGVGDVDDLGIRYSKMMPFMQSSGSNSAAMVFNNTFKIDGGGSGGGGQTIDMRRTVTLIADRLEDEMKRRMARSN